MNCYSDKCRVCLDDGKMVSIFEERYSLTIAAAIMTLAKVQILPKDGLPETICKKCLRKLDQCIALIKLCENSDWKLRSLNNSIASVSSNENCISSSAVKSWEYKDSTGITHEELNKNLVENSKLEISNADDEKKVNGKPRKAKKQQCPECGKILSSKFRLTTHLRTHSGESPFYCAYCSKNFKLKSDLVLHIRIHTGEKPLKCTYCDAVFRYPSSLRVHKRIHTGNAPYQCSFCTNRFRTASNLKYHIRLHTGEKNFECDICKKGFITHGHLKVHLRSHTGEKPYMCSICGLRLSRSSHLRRHVKHIHDPKRAERFHHKSSEHGKCDISLQKSTEEISLSSKTPSS